MSLAKKAGNWLERSNFNPVTSYGKAANYASQKLFPNPNADLKGIRQNQIDLLGQLLKPGGWKNLEQYFGPLTGPVSGLNRQADGGNTMAPEQRALQLSQPMLENIINGKPGQGVMDALQPDFLRNLSTANQQGGRFSSGNEILRSRAVEDFSKLGAQAAQQGQQTQLQAADMLRLLSGQAGEQGDLENQRRIQLMGLLLGGGQGVAFGPGTPQGGIGNQLLTLLGTLLGSKEGKP